MTAQILPPLAERACAPDTLPEPEGLGLTWSSLSAQDAPVLAELVAAIEAADEQPYRTSLAEVAERFEGAWKDHAHDTLAGRDGRGVLRAYAQVSTAPGDTRVVRVFLEAGVHPAWRGRGVGLFLVTWMQARGRQLLAASEQTVPGRLQAYLDNGVPAAHALYRAGGFSPVRYYAEMRRPLGAVLPTAPGLDGLRVVGWSPELDEGVRLAHNEAFADHWGSEPQTPEMWVQGRTAFAPGWSLVALDEASGEVAGYLISGRYEQDWEISGHTSGYVEILGVRRRWRRRGVAHALLVEAMALYRADGMECAEIGVDTENPSGAHGLYAGLGFEVVHGSTMVSIDV